jgi:hypothetical protein
LIKEWLISPEKTQQQKKLESDPITHLPIYLYGKENNIEEKYQFKTHFAFNTQEHCIK